MVRKKKEHRVFPSLHIKRGTSGTSNELSFSVLDNRKEESEGSEGSISVQNVGGVWLQTHGSGFGKSKKDTATFVPSSGLGSPASSPSSSAPVSKKREKARERAVNDPEAEINRRKRNRRIRRAIMVVSLCGCIGFAGYNVSVHFINEYQTHQSGLSLLSRGFAELEAADNLVLPLDSVVTGDIASTALEDIEEIQAGISGAEVHISAAETFANDAFSTLTDPEETAVASKIGESAEARRVMLEQASLLMEEDTLALSVMADMSQCWNLLIQADSLIKQASELVADTTVENTEASQELTEQARVLLEDALVLLHQIQEAYPDADLSSFEPYILKRIEGCDYAIASDEAIYLQDKKTAESNSEAFNQCEAEAAELASALPANPQEPILAAFDQRTQEARDMYLDARTQASQSDAYIRDYLSKTAD